MVSWPAIGTAIRVAQALWGSVAATFWPRALRVVSFNMAPEPAKGRWAGTIKIQNAGAEDIIVESLKLTSPAGGSLRYDPPIMLFFADQDTDPIREKALGQASLVMQIKHDIRPGQSWQFDYVFVPPNDWPAGIFSAELLYRVLAARESSRAISISKRL